MELEVIPIKTTKTIKPQTTGKDGVTSEVMPRKTTKTIKPQTTSKDGARSDSNKNH